MKRIKMVCMCVYMCVYVHVYVVVMCICNVYWRSAVNTEYLQSLSTLVFEIVPPTEPGACSLS